MRSRTLAILAIATVSMTTLSTIKSTTAQTYGPEYRYDLAESARSRPYFVGRGRQLDDGRHYSVSRGPRYNLGPDCATHSMWSWPFTC